MGRELEGEVALVTGASRGLGAALALAFARAGARVALCARGAEELERVAAGIRAEGGRCVATTVDLRREAEVAGWVAAAERELGTPSVLVNNASVLGPRVPLAEHDAEAWREVLDINLTGAFLCARAALAPMVRAGRGSIINVSSGAAIPPRTEWGAYAVSKDALEGFSRNLAEELRDTGVRVNAVDPGAMRTGMRAAAYPDEDPATLRPAEAKLAVFLWLASDASREVTGERFQADRWTPA